ncbi:hypothetical protein [Edaphobacter aggregans]|uniref:hypothetical protein n=1 Tax=Edaphobacter aggregans TaxID=570835 RepID=UPI00055722B6|nr:hypothetical protein [Edaphobacter aggregans]
MRLIVEYLGTGVTGWPTPFAVGPMYRAWVQDPVTGSEVELPRVQRIEGYKEAEKMSYPTDITIVFEGGRIIFPREDVSIREDGGTIIEGKRVAPKNRRLKD